MAVNEIYFDNDHVLQIGTVDDLLREHYSETAQTGISITSQAYQGPQGTTDKGEDSTDTSLGDAVAAVEQTDGIFTATHPASDWDSLDPGSMVYFEIKCTNPVFKWVTQDHTLKYRTP